MVRLARSQLERSGFEIIGRCQLLCSNLTENLIRTACNHPVVWQNLDRIYALFGTPILVFPLLS